MVKREEKEISEGTGNIFENNKEENKNMVKNLSSKIQSNPWMAISGVLVVILVVMIFGSGGLTGNVISEKDAGQNFIDFVKARTGYSPEILSVEEKDGFYLMDIDFRGQKSSLFVTKDGKYIVENPIPLVASVETDSAGQGEQVSAEVPKSDKPKVELFVMTHCPYGTQAEKGFIPAIKALGSKIDAKIRFVHYFMHDPEKTETPRQVCIREEQSAKYLSYLSCFLEDGDSDRCITKTGIDKAKMEKCIADKKSDEYYAQDSQLSNGYGVQGSPTLVINGQMADSGRDAVSMLNTICSAFNTAPAECTSALESLSGEAPSPGFGYSTAGTDAGSVAQCG